MRHASSMQSRLCCFLGAALALSVAGALLPSAASAAGTRTWNVAVGRQSPDEAIQGNVFLTNQVTIDEGDTVDWTVRSGEPHTVTFLFGETPPPFTSPPTQNISGGKTTIPSPNGGDPLVNTGIVNEYTQFSATFTQAGTYDYVCLLHAGMKGTVVVQKAGTPYPHPDSFYAQQSAQDSAQILEQGLNVFIGGLLTALQGGPKQVTAGDGAMSRFQGEVWIARFEPGQRVVRKGETVTWTDLDPATPHTVTIGPDPADFTVPAGNGTVTTSPGATTLNSGLIGGGFGPKSYAVTFDHVGVYNYYCALHDELGMKGTIVVGP